MGDRVVNGEAAASGGVMRFAKIVFIGAGVWGIAVLTPLY
jgi:hypothetical protein